MTHERVLQLIASDGVYGAERVILNLSRALRDAGTFRPVVGCIVPRQSRHSEMLEASRSMGLDSMRVPVSNALFWMDLPRIAGELRRQKIALIHAHGYKPSVFGYLLGRLARIPVTSTCHLWFRTESAPLKKRVMVAVEMRLYRRFPKVLAVSEDIRAVLLRNGVDPRRTAVISNGVDPFPPRPPEGDVHALRESFGISRGDFCVVNAARLTAQKAQWTLVEAAAILKARGDRCRFLIAGEGELEEDLRRHIEELGVTDCVQLLGFRADVNQLLAMGNVFALPSMDEGMPMSLLEAVALRVPVISTAVGDIPKLVVDGKSGVLIPIGNAQALADAILCLRSGALPATTLADAAHERLLSSYSTGAMCERYTDIYNNLLSRHQ